MEKLENFDLTKIIIGSVAGTVISLVIGVILFWLTFGTVPAYDAGVFSQGYTEFSFIVGVVVAAAFFGVKQNDVVSAGIVGFMSAKEVSEYSHGDMPWMIAEDNEDLEYEYVFYRDPEYTVREYDN